MDNSVFQSNSPSGDPADASPRARAGKARAWIGAYWPIVALFLATACLCLARLDNTFLWADEAEDAIFARNFLATGTLTAWDGRNLYAYHDGVVIDDKLRLRNPPLGALLTAAAFRAFGVSAWSARIHGVFFALLALALLAWLLAKEFPGDRATAFYASAFMALSPEFLLNARQCRYYAFCLLLAVAIFAAWRRFARRRSTAALVAIVFGFVLFFYSNWLLCAGYMLGLATMHAALCRDRWRRGDWARLAGAACLFAAATAPYAISREIWRRDDLPNPGNVGWLKNHLTLIHWNFREMNLIGSLPWMIVLAFVLTEPSRLLRPSRRSEQSRAAWRWMALGAANLFWLAMLSPQFITRDGNANMRYLIASAPFFACVAGRVLSRLHRVNRLAAAALLATLVSCNVASMTPAGWRFYWLLPAYLREATHPYPTAISEAAHYLERHAAQDEQAYVCPEYEAYPLMFVLGRKLRFAGVIDGACRLPEQELRALGAPLYKLENYPDWVIAFGSTYEADRAIELFSRPRLAGGQRLHYEYARVAVLNAWSADQDRPEIPMHSFGPNKDFDLLTEGVLVYRRTREPIFDDKAARRKKNAIEPLAKAGF